MDNLLKTLSAVFCALVIGSAAPAFASEGETHGKSAMLKHLEGLEGERFEQSFLRLMTHHHKSGVEMAELAEKQAKHFELRTLGTKIAKMQKQEIDEMTGWLEEWYDEEAEPHFQDAQSEKEMQMETKKLQASEGEEFDQAFLKAMSKHHRDGMAMAKLVPVKSKRTELVSAGKKMIGDQTRELEQMATWQESWFAKD